MLFDERCYISIIKIQEFLRSGQSADLSLFKWID